MTAWAGLTVKLINHVVAKTICCDCTLARYTVCFQELYTTLWDKVCQWLAAGGWFFPGTPVAFTNKTDCHDITEILLKVALNTINQTKQNLFPVNIFVQLIFDITSTKNSAFVKQKDWEL